MEKIAFKMRRDGIQDLDDFDGLLSNQSFCFHEPGSCSRINGCLSERYRPVLGTACIVDHTRFQLAHVTEARSVSKCLEFLSKFQRFILRDECPKLKSLNHVKSFEDPDESLEEYINSSLPTICY